MSTPIVWTELEFDDTDVSLSEAKYHEICDKFEGQMKSIGILPGPRAPFANVPQPTRTTSPPLPAATPPVSIPQPVIAPSSDEPSPEFLKEIYDLFYDFRGDKQTLMDWTAKQPTNWISHPTTVKTVVKGHQEGIRNDREKSVYAPSLEPS